MVFVPDHVPNRPPDQGWLPLHETTPGLFAESTSGDDVAHTGTTVVGLVAGESAVLAADQRASVGGGRLVTNKQVQKIDAVHPTGAIALSGVVGHLQHLVRVLRAETRLYADRRDDDLSMDALATLAGNVLRGAPMQVSPLLAGVDDSGAHVFDLDAGGGVMEDTYAAGGSGMQLAYGVLEDQYDPDADTSTARQTAATAIHAASQRDTASGNGITIATISAEGVELDTYADREEVA